MFKKIKDSIIVTVSVLLFAVPVLSPALAHAQTTTPAPTTTDTVDIRSNLCAGSDLTAPDATTAANCDKVDAEGVGSANTLIKNVINIFSLVVGIVSVIMIILGGFKYITSGGNDGNVSGAKNTILYAVIGLVIVSLAQIIVRFVLAKSKTI